MRFISYSYLAIVLTVGAWAGIHLPNDNKLCQRAGCGHYKNAHANGNGECEYADYVYVFPGHCEGFLR